MPNPKRKHTRSRRDSRRASNWRLEAPAASACGQCGGRRLPHRVCPHCGFYGGELVIARRVRKKDQRQGGGAPPPAS